MDAETFYQLQASLETYVEQLLARTGPVEYLGGDNATSSLSKGFNIPPRSNINMQARLEAL